MAWRYPRTEPLPKRGPELESARASLLQEVGRDDPAFEVSGSRVLEVAAAPAVEVTGTQTISKRKLRVRSVHLYAEGSEIVIETVAPEETFARVERDVLEPLLASLRVG